MPVSGADTVAQNIKSFGGGFTKHVTKVMKEAVKMLDKEVEDNMSLTDHTQEELTAMGHPYARRHGPEGMGIHNPAWLVHKQTGNLLKSKFKGHDDAKVYLGQLIVRGWVGLDEMQVPYANDIIWGNSRMIPRDVLAGSLFDKDLRREVSDLFSKDLRDLVINFKGKETRG